MLYRNIKMLNVALYILHTCKHNWWCFDVLGIFFFFVLLSSQWRLWSVAHENKCALELYERMDHQHRQSAAWNWNRKSNVYLLHAYATLCTEYKWMISSWIKHQFKRKLYDCLLEKAEKSPFRSVARGNFVLVGFIYNGMHELISFNSIYCYGNTIGRPIKWVCI